MQIPGDKEELHLLFVGRISYGKGVQYLLKAVRHLLDQGCSVSGTIVGDGWYAEKLRALCAQLGIERSIRFAGQVPGTEMDAFYDTADIVVVPSVWPEPAGLVVPEARRRGKPVVVFDAGGLPEWQAHMDGIYVAGHADVANLAQTITDAAFGKPGTRNARAGSGRLDLIDDLRGFIQLIRKEAARL
ncbi:glycosyltransferase family 4 protein [Cohnella faecalis]|uniref:glycosyltransferase family 4 protein n=1 Tax=Cohnella faecalis TaxID=2315694 RepID=UPI0013147FE6|nr:glycosyltransferase family 4 protein [Cohnella faecalis]